MSPSISTASSRPSRGGQASTVWAPGPAFSPATSIPSTLVPSGSRLENGPRLLRLGLTATLALAVLASGCASTAPPAVPSRDAVADRWGVEVLGVHSSAAGYLLDFRYRVVDPVKAAPLLDRGVTPYVIAESSGARLLVPSPPKVGSLRNTGRPLAGRRYFALFANPGRSVRPGERVTVVVGDFRAEGILVE